MNPKTAITILILLIAAVAVFHLSILLKIIPYEITWGGRLKSDSEMYVFETLSIAINLFLIMILLVKGKFVKEWIPLKVVNAALWVFMVLFGLNTIGNVLAETNFEKSFALVTFTSSILIWIIIRKEKKQLRYDKL